MKDRIAELEARIAEVSCALRAMEARVALLERQPTAARPRHVPGAPAVGGAPTLAGELSALTRGLARVGGLLLVLAGAFLLRAVTEAGTVQPGVGVGLGLAYASAWLVAADRAAARGRIASAGWHAAGAVVVALPLLFEVSTRLGLLSTAWSLAGVAAFTAATLGIAIRRRAEPLAWIAVVSGIAAALAFAIGGAGLRGPVLTLVGLGVATLWIGYVLDWRDLRWPVAVVADLLALVLALQASRPGAAWPGASLGVLAALVVGYLASIAIRTLWLGRAVVRFEVAQAMAAVATGLGGAAWIASRWPAWAGGLGVGSVAVGLAAYGVAFAFVQRRAPLRGSFAFHAAIAFPFVLIGTGLAFAGEGRALAWAGLAMAAGVVARLGGGRTLAVHAAAYGCAAAVAAGLVPDALAALLGMGEAPPAEVAASRGVVLAAMAVAAWLTADAAPGRRHADRLPRLALMVALALGVTALALRLVVPAIAGAPDGGVSPAVAATVRTAVLVAVSLGAACVGRIAGWREAGWLAYPVLALVGLKLLVEDLARGRPATLVVAFALYGAALIAVPRLRRPAPRPAVA